MPKKKKQKISKFTKAMYTRLLKACERSLAQDDVVIIEDVKKLREMQVHVTRGEELTKPGVIKYSMWYPFLHYYKRLAAKELNEKTEKGIPKTTRARRNMAKKIRLGWFGDVEHFIRDTVRYLYPVRGGYVKEHTRKGRRVCEYARCYGDPREWIIPDELLSENAKIMYRYVLDAPLLKASNWHNKRY